MIEHLDQDLKKRVNNAIANIRLIATRVKRVNILDAAQKAEIVVSLLNEFRQYINAYQVEDWRVFYEGSFKHDNETISRVVQATMQADNIYNMLTRERKKSYTEEYKQVWTVLENIHSYLATIMAKGG
jgi:hypothetical protein